MKSFLDTLTTRLPDRITQSNAYAYLRAPWRAYRQRQWQRQGCPPPVPAFIKQTILRHYGQQFQLKTLVETGTQHADMIVALAADFDHIYSIELSFDLWTNAQKRCAPYPNITLLQGDSGQQLPTLLPTLTHPTLFWLDAHAMRGGVRASLLTPVIDEVTAVCQHPTPGHVILIDDARLFVGQNDYPTLPQLHDLVKHWHPDWLLSVETDIIRLHPPLKTDASLTPPRSH